MGFCENLTKLTPDNIIPMFLHMFFYVAAKTLDSLHSTYTAIKFEFIPQPEEEVQSEEFNRLTPYLFVYMAGLVIKNATDSLMVYQSNREKGLERAAFSINLIINEGHYVVPKLALQALSDFMASNTDILSDTFKTVLGLSNSNNRTAVYAYAHELRGELAYANMNGIEIIENFLLGERHPCLSDPSILAMIQQYEAFKLRAIGAHGLNNWKYVAILDK
jgi:hypothetical protein